MTKIGIVGAGGMGKAHARALTQIDQARISAVADPDAERRKALAKEYGAKPYASIGRLLSSDLDAVYICTPPYLHPRQVAACAEAGKHIFCEKPLAITLRGADRMLEAADKANVRLAVGYVLNFNPLHRSFIKHFRAGKLGELVSCWVHRITYFGRSRYGWLGDPRKSGGMLIECMSHEVDWMLHLGGQVESVYAKVDSVGDDWHIDNYVSAILNFKRGGYGALTASWSTKAANAGRGVVGTEGSMVTTGKDVLVALGDQEPHPLELQPADAVRLESEDFLASIRDGREPLIGGKQARDALEVCLAIHRSGRRGRLVKLPL